MQPLSRQLLLLLTHAPTTTTYTGGDAPGCILGCSVQTCTPLDPNNVSWVGGRCPHSRGGLSHSQIPGAHLGSGNETRGDHYWDVQVSWLTWTLWCPNYSVKSYATPDSSQISFHLQFTYIRNITIHIRFPWSKNAISEHLHCQAETVRFCTSFPALLSGNITCSLTTKTTSQTYHATNHNHSTQNRSPRRAVLYRVSCDCGPLIDGTRMQLVAVGPMLESPHILNG